jgi:hypothetical protein
LFQFGKTIGGLFFNEQGLISKIEYYNRNLMNFYTEGTDSVERSFEYRFSPFVKRVKVIETVKSNHLAGEITKHSLYKKNRLISKRISSPNSEYYLVYEINYDCTNPKISDEGFTSKIVPFEVSSISYFIGNKKEINLIQKIEFIH